MDNVEKSKISNEFIEQKLEEIYVLLKTIQINQQNEMLTIKENHVTNMKRLNKLQEYNQIADITNQIFEIRITGIEEALKKLTIAVSEGRN